jgi:quercetin dioxygenase-like cupin family protein
MTFAYYAVETGPWIHEHSHPNDIDGQLEITIGRDAREVDPGYAAIIPPDAAHSLKALTDARAIGVDHPSRYSIAGIEF